MAMRKYILTILILTTWATFSKGQNLVPNPSFEDTTSCPVSVSDFSTDEVSKAFGWSSFGNTPDYFNSCNSGIVGVPLNFFAEQDAATGNAYCGLYNYAGTLYKEYIGCQLLSPLLNSTKYYVSFKVSLSGRYGHCESSKIGCRFSTIPYSTLSLPMQNNFAQVFSSTIISDTLNWVTISGNFIADSSYQYIILGNFFDNTQTDTSNCYGGSSYFFIDDICVSTDSNYCSTWTGLKDKTSFDTFKIYPNPASQSATLEFNNPSKKKCTLTLYDLHGQVLRTVINITTERVEIERHSLTSGLYFFQLRTDNEIIIRGKLTME